MADSLNRDEELAKLVGYVEEYIDATVEPRRLSERCRDYYDGYQWTESERAALRKRKQPCITNNRIKPKVQFLRGMEMQTRTDPKAFPRNPDDEESAEVSTDMLRYISDNNMSEQKYSKGFFHYLVEGTEGHEVIVTQKRGKFEIEHNVMQWDRMWWDPHSREEDFSDCRYKGTLQWMDTSEGKEDFPDAPDEVWTLETGDTTDTFEDRPSFFTDKNRKRVRVFFAYYIKRGVWHYAIFTKGGFIKAPAPSPYLDEDGQPEPQFEMQSAFVDLDGGRYGEVASYMDLQDEVNKRRSKLLHLMSVRQTFGTKGAGGDDSQVKSIKSELAKPDGHVEFITGEFGKEFGIIPTNDMAAGQATLLEEAKQEIDSQGANAALAGTDPRSLSGRAVQSLQQGGSVEIGPLFDGHKACKNRVERMKFNRAMQFWTEERWIRVTDSEENVKFTGINKQVTLGEKLMEEAEELKKQNPEAAQAAMADLAQLQGDPRLSQVVGVANPVNELDIDIIISEAPNTVTLQQEQFEVLSTLYQANPNAVPFELLIKASQLRNKDELLKLIKGGDEEQQAAMAKIEQQEQQEQRELLKAGAVADIEEKKASTEDKLASAEKKRVEAEETAIDAAIKSQEATAPV